MHFGFEDEANDKGLPPWMTSFMSLSSVFALISMLANSFLGSGSTVNLSSTVRQLLVVGPLIELGRRLFQWLSARIRFRLSITAQFDEGDPAYDWIMLLLKQEDVWRGSRDFFVTANSSRRKWDVQICPDSDTKDHAEYVPTYHDAQLFRWRGCWVEVSRSRESLEGRYTSRGTYRSLSSLHITMYTLNMARVAELVEDARSRYVEVNLPNVVIHIADEPDYGSPWTTVKHRMRRPLSTVILPPGVVDNLVNDVKEFINSEDWYSEAGIPHRRGYLLYGPPGTGKTSTIYALAGTLNLEIYSLSLASDFVDDAFLQRAADEIPKNSIFLIEDIDCAFASRSGYEEDNLGRLARDAFDLDDDMPMSMRVPRSEVTLSRLLNVIDGVGSEGGKLFFATDMQTNYIDRLDLALLRPGRIDHKVQYELATEEQARALFMRFFPPVRFPQLAVPAGTVNVKGVEKERAGVDALEDSSLEQTVSAPPGEHQAASDATSPSTVLDTFATAFAAQLPQNEFSTAELQGYLQGHKADPEGAIMSVQGWIDELRAERGTRKKREEERERRVREKRERLMLERDRPKEKDQDRHSDARTENPTLGSDTGS
ncbi:hypothetical protein MKEN_00401300 [Mycena kentingensis (nom. inval.)]|nr:hypothetical protein MKEN_00401300 [Mycena kentingensis (nom. inval.)]